MTSSYPLKSLTITTPLGDMVAIADDEALYMLQFAENRKLTAQIDRLKQQKKSNIETGLCTPLHQIEEELKKYFQGNLKEFSTPFCLLGTPFQQHVWTTLITIAYGTTCSYAHVAQTMGHPTSFRAVANGNGANQLAIMIPCHRVIHKNGLRGGYAGGIHRKEWLLRHERL